MKLLFLRTDFYGSATVGGSFSHIKGFLDGMSELGVESIASASASLYDNPTHKLYSIPYSRTFDSFPEIHSIAHNRTLRKRLPEIIEKEKPDFIYQRHSEFIYESVFLAKKYGISLILEVNQIESWWKKNWSFLFFEKLLRNSEEVLFHSADALMTVSEVLKQDLIRMFHLPPEKIFVNPNGVDIKEFSDSIDSKSFFDTLPGELQKKWKDKFLCGFLGTFGEWHGVEVLAKAVKHAIEKNPQIHFVLIGDGKLRKNVESILAKDGMSGHVTMLGLISHKLVPKYLSLCDVLLSPHVENADGTVFFGSPTKLFEYMGMGKAIIASNVGQIGSVIQDGENGLIVKQRDEKDLAEKIHLLASNEPLRKKLGQTSRRDAVEKYSWKQNAKRVLDVYEQISIKS